jgi:glycosidase
MCLELFEMRVPCRFPFAPVTFVLIALTVAVSACGPDESSNNEPTPQTGELPLRTCTATLEWDGSSDSVEIVGEFNDWQPQEVDGAITLDLDPGEYAWNWVVNGQARPLPRGIFTKWHDGAEYRNLRIPSCDAPGLQATDVSTEGGTLTATLQFSGARSGATIDPASLNITVGGEEPTVEVDTESGEITVTHELSAPGKWTVRATAADTEGVTVEDDLWLPVWWDEGEPFVWQDGLMYLIFTDRFRNADGSAAAPAEGVAEIAAFNGGDFAGVTQAIENGYFEDLGVNTLWLSPIYENPAPGFLGVDGSTLYTGYHGYWPVEPLSAEENYGGDAALQELIDAAHAKGMRILFDIVLNHVHEEHIYCDENPSWCQTTCVCGSSDTCRWEGEGGRPLDCQFAPYLPDLSYRNHDILRRVVDDTMALAEKFDVDGFRIDAAKHMDHVIMRSIRLEVEALEAQGAAEFYLVGETFTGDRGLIMNYVADDELHGQFDFPVMYAIQGTFNGGSFRDLEGAAAESQRRYGSFYEWMSPFVGNHDIPRYATVLAGNDQGPFNNTPDLMAEGGGEITQWNIINRMSMAFAFLLGQPGVPLLYYGDEIALAGSGDPDNRRVMPTMLNANRTEMLRRVQELGQARQAIPALRRGDRTELWVDDNMYVFARDTTDRGTAIIAMNKGETPRTEAVTVPNAFGIDGQTLTPWARDDRDDLTVRNGEVVIELDPWEYVIWHTP